MEFSYSLSLIVMLAMALGRIKTKQKGKLRSPAIKGILTNDGVY